MYWIYNLIDNNQITSSLIKPHELSYRSNVHIYMINEIKIFIYLTILLQTCLLSKKKSFFTITNKIENHFHNKTFLFYFLFFSIRCPEPH